MQFRNVAEDKKMAQQNAAAAKKISLKDKYSEDLTSDLNNDEMDQYVDLDDRQTYSDFFDLDPQEILSELAEKVEQSNTPPDAFHDEMKKLVRSDEKPFQEDQETINQLKAKYGISENCSQSDLLTVSKLKFVFPHYCHFFDTVPNLVAPAPKFHVPAGMKEPCFGGLIPSTKYSGHAVFNETRKEIITIFLHLRKEMKACISIRAHHIMLSKLISKSILSDSRRIRALKKNKVIDMSGKLTKPLRSLLECIKTTDFPSEINWAFFSRIGFPTLLRIKL